MVQSLAGAVEKNWSRDIYVCLGAGVKSAPYNEVRGTLVTGLPTRNC
jgi:hypothetical protein